MNGFAPLIMSYMYSFEKLIHEWSVDHLIFFFKQKQLNLANSFKF